MLLQPHRCASARRDNPDAGQHAAVKSTSVERSEERDNPYLAREDN